MKIAMRVGVFETNSSSMHSFTMISPEQLEQWKAGELFYDEEYGFVDRERADELAELDDNMIPVSYDDFVGGAPPFSQCETEVTRCVTPGGETVYVVSYVGWC